MNHIYFDPQTRAIADLAQVDPTQPLWIITRINVPAIHRGKGLGRKLLKQITDQADEEGVTLTLIPWSSGPLNSRELIAWYSRHGFERTPSGLMIREPQ